MRRSALLVVVSLLALVGALAASAGPPGSWTRLTDTNGRNIDQVGLTRTPDGVLHVFWQKRIGAGNEAIAHTTVNPAGKPGGTNIAFGGLSSVNNPDAVVTADNKLRVFFAGLGSGSSGVASATAPLSGATWTKESPRVSSTTSAVGPVGAAVDASGGPVFAYSISFHLGLHVGLDPAQPDRELQPDTKCCDYLPDVATDAASKQTVIASYSNAGGRPGIWAQTVLPNTGPRLLAPGSLTGGRAIGVDQRTAITARIGAPGVYVAYCSGYPTCTRALLWRVGTKKALAAGGSKDVEDVNVASGPDGRLWVMWHDGQSSRTIFVRRTNRAATRFGPLVRVQPPSGTSNVWKLSGEGSLGALDLLASVGTGSALATWHTQVRPPLALSASRSKAKVTFRVTDAGDPVAGATVKVAGKSLKTNASGRATTTLRGGGTATASKGSYAPASARVGA
jgi:hypothetical protein